MVISSRWMCSNEECIASPQESSEEIIGIWFYLKLKRFKINFISYLSLGHAVLLRGMQYVVNDYSSAQKSQ